MHLCETQQHKIELLFYVRTKKHNESGIDNAECRKIRVRIWTESNATLMSMKFKKPNISE